MDNSESRKEIQNVVLDAFQTDRTLNIVGHDSKSFYGNAASGDELNVSSHTGVIDYEPSELFITVRCGTPLREVESTLRAKNQMLPFEPPSYGHDATIGGTIACGLSGPRRPYTCAARDCILGVHIINGKGEYLQFGGQVMKNVAGYDISRLMCGALGTLGILMQISIKVIPSPLAESTLAFEYDAVSALNKMNQWALSDLPISATYFESGVLYVRVSGIESAIEKVKTELGGQEYTDHDSLWKSVKEHQREFFDEPQNLWRLSVPNNVPPYANNTDCAIEWNGGLRWINCRNQKEDMHQIAEDLQGTACLFKSNVKPQDCFHPLPTKLKKLHLNLKQAFDPKHILNPGRMYSWC